MDGQKLWEFCGTTKYASKRLIVAEVMKQAFLETFKEHKEMSYRLNKELTPVLNRLKQMKQLEKEPRYKPQKKGKAKRE